MGRGGAEIVRSVSFLKLIGNDFKNVMQRNIKPAQFMKKISIDIE